MSLIKILSTDEAVVVPITVGILQILSPTPQYYRSSYPHSRGNTTIIVRITAVLPPFASPCHSLICNTLAFKLMLKAYCLKMIAI